MYNIPGRSGVEIAQDTICRLFDDFENIVAVKHATGSVDGARRLRQASEIDIISGDDPLTFDLMSAGAIGVISVVANILPARIKALTDAFLAGDLAGARSAHDELLPFCEAMLSLETNPIPIKTAMAMKHMLEEEFRLPMCPMMADNKARLHNILTAAGLL